MSRNRWSPYVAVPLGLALSIAPFAVPPTAAAAGSAGHVRPGAAVTIAGVHCRVGLLLRQRGHIYAAVPASCAALPLEEGKTQNGCVAASAPVGTPTRVDGARRKATLVYDSFTYMQSVGEKKRAKCFYNDLALLQLHPTDAAAARPGVAGDAPPRRAARRAPSNGSSATCGTGPAVFGATTHHGWVHPLTSAPSATADDVGLPVAQGRQLVGMLTILPSGTVMMRPAAAYDLFRALKELRRAPGFHRVRLLR